MDDELESLRPLLGGEFLVLHTLGVVSNGRNDTTLRRAILGKDQVAALGGRSVMAVDKVKTAGPSIAFLVAERVGPRGNVAHVSRRLVAQDGLDLLHSIGGEILLSDRRDGGMAELAPGADGRGLEDDGEDDGGLHDGRRR